MVGARSDATETVRRVEPVSHLHAPSADADGVGVLNADLRRVVATLERLQDPEPHPVSERSAAPSSRAEGGGDAAIRKTLQPMRPLAVHYSHAHSNESPSTDEREGRVGGGGGSMPRRASSSPTTWAPSTASVR